MCAFFIGLWRMPGLGAECDPATVSGSCALSEPADGPGGKRYGSAKSSRIAAVSRTGRKRKPQPPVGWGLRAVG